MDLLKIVITLFLFLIGSVNSSIAQTIDNEPNSTIDDLNKFENLKKSEEVIQVISKLFDLSQNSSDYKISKNYDKLRYWLSAKACVSLMNSNRIHILNDKNKILLLEKLELKTANRNDFFSSIKNYKGFFVPQLARIFVPESQQHNSINETLMHECIHAYQYLYRLPSDIEALKKSQLIKEEEFVEYLSFYYETEAHWLMHKYHAPAAWKKFALKQSESSISKFIRVLGNAGSIGLANVAGSKIYNDNVPIPDKIGSYGGLSNSNVYWFSMPSSVPQSGFLLTFMGGFRFDFQATFLESLQNAQFKNRAPFLFDTNGLDRKVFNLLTDNFYTQSDKIKEHIESYQKILASSLLIPDIGIFSIEDRLNQENITNYNANFKKLVTETYKGGEGSSPQIDFLPINKKILPHLELQPQISFDPIQRNEQNNE